MSSDHDPRSTPAHRALVAELLRTLEAGGGMGAVLRRERQAGSPCIPLILAAREAFGISLMDAKTLSGYLGAEPDERFDARVLSTIDPVRWPPPPEEGPLGINRAFDAGESVAAILREARAEGLDESDAAIALREAFGLSRDAAAVIARRIGAASDAEIDAALRDVARR